MAECIVLKDGGADLDVVTAGVGDVLSGKVIVGPDGEPLTGTLALDGNAADNQVLAGRTYYNTDPKVKRVGTIASMAGQTINPTASQQTVASSGKYMTGNVVVNGVSNLTAANVKKGVNVGGTVGAFEGWVGVDTDLYINGNNKANFVLSSQGSSSGFEVQSGMMFLKFGGNVNINLRSTVSYNLSLYSKLNIYFGCAKSWSNGLIYYLEDYGTIRTETDAMVKDSYYTTSLNIAGFNGTILPKISMWASGSGTSGQYGAGWIYIYRIYLS